MSIPVESFAELPLGNLAVVDCSYNTGFLKYVAGKTCEVISCLGRNQMSNLMYYEGHDGRTHVSQGYSYRYHHGPFQIITESTKTEYVKHMSKRLHLLQQSNKNYKGKKDDSVQNDIYKDEVRQRYDESLHKVVSIELDSAGDPDYFSTQLILRKNNTEVKKGAIKRHSFNSLYAYYPITDNVVDKFIRNIGEHIKLIDLCCKYNENQAIPKTHPMIAD